jgi:hypothetical protein
MNSSRLGVTWNSKLQGTFNCAFLYCNLPVALTAMHTPMAISAEGLRMQLSQLRSGLGHSSEFKAFHAGIVVEGGRWPAAGVYPLGGAACAPVPAALPLRCAAMALTR